MSSAARARHTVGTEVCCPPLPPGYVLFVLAYMCRRSVHVAASASRTLASACRCISLAARYWFCKPSALHSTEFAFFAIMKTGCCYLKSLKLPPVVTGNTANIESYTDLRSLLCCEQLWANASRAFCMLLSSMKSSKALANSCSSLS